MITEVVNEAALAAQLDDNPRALLLFTQPSTCAPCRAFEPHYTAASEALDGISFLRADIDSADPALVSAFGVMGVPSLFALDAEGNWVTVKSRTAVALTNEVTALYSQE